MDIKDLTKEELTALEAQLEARKKGEKEKEIRERETLKQLQHEFVETFFPKLIEVAKNLTLSKGEVFDGVRNVLALKKTVYNMSDEAWEKQQTHTFSTQKCDRTIIVGYNVVDGWNRDLAASGVEGVNQWLSGKLNESNAELVEMIRDLLRPNKEGLLKANRVLELYNRAVKIGDEELISHVREIQEAYVPQKTSTFVKAKYKDEDGRDIWLNLSMSNA
ncbi:MAG: DUF3164 family protein [Dysgonamonadaceae bacterium]|jgi:hypothetical protein|nr:DUF3164 family protein [Dysgonamonadaceae bacterium]